MLDRVSTQSVKKSSRYGMSSSVILLSLVAGVVATHGGLGCGGSLGDECAQHSDCSDDGTELCIFGRCHNACSDDIDCNNDKMCFSDDTDPNNEKNFCAVPKRCTHNNECKSTDDEVAQHLVCSSGVCRKQCERDADCPQTQHCLDSVCLKKCSNSQNCLEGEQCFDGSCAKKDPAEKRDSGDFCRIHSDCISLNCIEQACEGCRYPVDCGGRTCLNITPEEPSAGICSDGEISGANESGESSETADIPIAESPFGVNELSMNPIPEIDNYAILDSNGENTYFVVEWFDDNGNANYDLVMSSDGSNPEKICTLPLIPHGPISLSHDDEKLYWAGFSSKLNNGGVFQIDINPVTSSCGTPVLIPWTAGYFVQAIDVRKEEDENQMKKDTLYISGTKLFGGLHAIISGDPSAPMHSTWLEVDWAAYSIAAAEKQVFASPNNDSDLKSHEELLLGVIKPGLMSNLYSFNAAQMNADQFNVAFNTAEDTLYVAINDASDNKEGYILAINTSKQPPIIKYKLDGVSNIHRMYRARNDDTFLLTTGEDKLFRINLSSQP